MIHVVTAGNRNLYRRELAMMHAQRAAMFIDQLGWPLQRSAAGGDAVGVLDAGLCIYEGALSFVTGISCNCRDSPDKRDCEEV